MDDRGIVMVRTKRARRWTTAIGAAAAVLVLAGCQGVPLRYDTQTEATTSQASYRVSKVETSKGPGIEIRFRNCNQVVLENLGEGYPEGQTISSNLQPRAKVVDGTGKIFYDTLNWAPYWIQPAGSSATRSLPDEPAVGRIVVPLAGAKGTLKVSAGCTNYPGYGSGGGYFWNFRSCETGSWTCNPRTAGSGYIVYGA